MQNIQIQKDWHNTAFSILEASRVIKQQKEALSKEEYEKWLANQPISEKSAAKIKKIVENPILGNPAYTAKLPPHWGKLYEASFLPDVYLKDKITNGGLEEISRHDIYKIRNRPTREKVRPVGRGSGLKILPEYERLSNWLRAGLKEEAKGIPTYKVGKIIHMRSSTYGRGRRVVMLDERTDLNPEDRRVVKDAMDLMDKTNSISAPLRMIEPILKKIYRIDGRGHPSNEKRRKEEFGNAISIICDTCLNAIDVKIPYLGRAEIMETVNQLLDAIGSLNKLVDHIRRSGND